jgi:ferredoxin
VKPEISASVVTSFCATLDDIEEVIGWQPGDVMLDSMLDAGLDPAFQCQDGHCGTCMVLLTGGEVRMRKNNALSPRDLERGYILLCQSEPLTADVSVDCDN